MKLQSFAFVFSNLVTISLGRFIVKLKPETFIIQKPDDHFKKIHIGNFNGLIVEDNLTLANFMWQGVVDYYEVDSEVTTNQIYQWGLDRIDQPDFPLDKSYTPNSRGKNTFVYVLDTGVRKTHQEFEDRVEYGINVVDNEDPVDRHGHGTHVMSTVLGKDVGVANKARGVAVKVLSDGGTGSSSGVIEGIEWAVNDILNNKRCGVISMSLGGGKSSTMNEAVNEAVKSGVSVIVAAGNYNRNACLGSPASAEKAISVGASTSSDWRSGFSNYGPCTHLFAPGSQIVGAHSWSDRSYRTVSGTSMACPHVSGAALLLLENNFCNHTGLKETLIDYGVVDKLSNMPAETPNVLLQVQDFVSSPPTTGLPTSSPTPRPTASPTISPTVDACEKECNSIRNRCKCWYNRAMVTNDNECQCRWRRRKKLCVPRKNTEPPSTPSPVPDFKNCRQECRAAPNKCGCKLNKYLGNKCRCKWKRRRKRCVPK